MEPTKLGIACSNLGLHNKARLGWKAGTSFRLLNLWEACSRKDNISTNGNEKVHGTGPACLNELLTYLLLENIKICGIKPNLDTVLQNGIGFSSTNCHLRTSRHFAFTRFESACHRCKIGPRNGGKCWGVVEIPKNSKGLWSEQESYLRATKSL